MTWWGRPPPGNRVNPGVPWVPVQKGRSRDAGLCSPVSGPPLPSLSGQGWPDSRGLASSGFHSLFWCGTPAAGHDPCPQPLDVAPSASSRWRLGSQSRSTSCICFDDPAWEAPGRHLPAQVRGGQGSETPASPREEYQSIESRACGTRGTILLSAPRR